MRTSAQRFEQYIKLFGPTSQIEHTFHEQIFNESKKMFVLNTDGYEISTGENESYRDNLLCENYCHLICMYRGLMQIQEIRDMLQQACVQKFKYFSTLPSAENLELHEREANEVIDKYCEMIKKETESCQYMRVYFDADCEMFVLI